MDKYLQQIKSLLKHELITGSFWLFMGGMLGNFLAFIFNVYLARHLSYADYGAYASLLSVYTLLTIPAGTLTAVIVRFATHYFANNEENKAASFYKKMLLVWGGIGIGLFCALLLFNPIFLSFLNIRDASLIFVLALAIGISYLGVVNNSFLQSLTKFSSLSLFTMLGSLAKLLVGGALVILDFRVFGAFVGVLALPLVALLLGFIPLAFLIKDNKESVPINFREILAYAGPVSLGLLALSSFITTDVILVKHFFHEDMAGLYGGLSIVGKVIFYFTAFIPSVMFPLVVKKHVQGAAYKGTYFLSMGLVLLPSIAITVFYFVFPSFVLNLFLGKNYLQLAPLLGLFGIFITLFNLTSVTVNFFLSIKKTSASLLVLFFALMQIVLIYLFHSDFYQIIFSSIFSISLLLALLLIYFYKSKNS